MVAKCVDGATLNVLDENSAEKLLDSLNSGLIPSHVLYKKKIFYVTNDNDVDATKAAAILNNKPYFQSQFDSASKMNVLFLMIALFVNVSNPDGLTKDLKHRNKCLRGFIHSVKVVFTKQHTTEGHVKLFLCTKQVKIIFCFMEKLPF